MSFAIDPGSILAPGSSKRGSLQTHTGSFSGLLPNGSSITLSAEEEVLMQQEVDRLRSGLLHVSQRRSKYKDRLSALDQAVCKAATDLALEQGRTNEVDDIYSALVKDAVLEDLVVDAFLPERDALVHLKFQLDLEIASEVALFELGRPLERWVRLCSQCLVADDARCALSDERELLEEARSGKGQDLETLLMEIEILEVTNTQLRSFEAPPASGTNSASFASTNTASSVGDAPSPKTGGKLARFGSWLLGTPPSSEAAQQLASAPPGELLVDDLITCCWEARQWKPGVHVKYPEAVLKSLLVAVRQVFMAECALLEVEAPIKICGDIHGQYHDLLRLFEAGGTPPESNYMFMGDYVDRGRQSIETITLLFTYKVKYPENFFLLRGNHECASITRMYGFHDECKRRYNVNLWKDFVSVFNCMPICGLIDNKIMCMHGGLSPMLEHFDEVRAITKPADVPHRGIMCDLLWADPEKFLDGWQPSDRGVSYVFGPNVVKDFVAKHELDLICRAHQVMEDGYEFFADRRLVTVFSAPNYCGEFDNLGAFMVVGRDLRCRFDILKPVYS